MFKKIMLSLLMLPFVACVGLVLSLTPPINTAFASPARAWQCSAAHTGGAIATAAIAHFTVTCPQAAVGDLVNVSADADSLLLQNTAYVSAAGTVTVILSNNSGISVTSPTTTYNVSGTPAYVSP